MRLWFFPVGSGTHIPVSKLVKDQRVQKTNVFSPSTQCTESVNEARQRPFNNPLKSTFIRLYGALVRPHVEYGRLACSPNPAADINRLDRIRRLITKLIAVICHLHSFLRQGLLADQISAFNIFMGLMNVDPNVLCDRKGSPRGPPRGSPS